MKYRREEALLLVLKYQIDFSFQRPPGGFPEEYGMNVVVLHYHVMVDEK